MRPSAPPAASRHLGAHLSAYVDRDLPAEVLRRCDQHLVVCAVCRAAADAERRLLHSLRGARTPGVPSRLEASLLGLAQAAEAPAGPAPLALVARTAPALHRSPVRAAVLAGLAAGASAAAAWGIGFAIPSQAVDPPTARLSVAPQAPRLNGPTPSGFTATVSVTDTGRPFAVSAPRPAVLTSRTTRTAHWAELRHD